MRQSCFLLACTILLHPSFQAKATPQTATPHHPEDFIESLKNDPQAGEKVYGAFCAVCHDQDPQIPLGAPRIGIAEDWTSRCKSLKELTKSVIDGLSAMPARGGCFECSDALLEAATHYMAPKKENSVPK